MTIQPARKAAQPAEAWTTDLFLGGLVTLLQPRTGHRAGLDAALLQALVPSTASGEAVDLGCGVGTAAFSVAARCPGMRVAGVEQSPELVACAGAALAHPANAAFASRVRIVRADVTAARAAREASGLPDCSADWVLMNPPFDQEGEVRPSPDPARRSAHVAPPASLAEWSRTAAGLLKPGGLLGLIHRAAALPAVLDALRPRLGDIRVLPVHPSAERPAKRVIVRARLGSRAGPQIMPGLVLHDAGGAWTAQADAILRGRDHLKL